MYTSPSGQVSAQMPLSAAQVFLGKAGAWGGAEAEVELAGVVDVEVALTGAAGASSSRFDSAFWQLMLRQPRRAKAVDGRIAAGLYVGRLGRAKLIAFRSPRLVSP